MKRCPTCQRTFEDNSLTYCLDDGTPLVAEVSSADSEATLVTPSPGSTGSRELPATQYGQLPGKATVSASQGQVPGMPSYAPPAPPRRSSLPWVLAGLAILFLIVIVIAAAIAIPRMMKNSNNSNNSNRRVIVQDAPPANKSSEAPSPGDSATENSATTDKSVALEQVTEVEKQWIQANVSGDKDAIDRILADEYSASDEPRNKQDYLATLKPDPTIKSWELEDLNLELEGDHATLNGYVRLQTSSGEQLYGFTDTFVWRDGRWQADGSHASRVK